MHHVVITGSSRGLGLAMAREFLKAGCKVTFSGRGGHMSDELARTLEAFKDSYQYVPCNVQKMKDVEALWTQAAAKWGRVDIWINNAGQNCPHEVCHSTGESYVNAVIDTNIKGVIFGSQVAARNMLVQGGGQIWNMEGLGSNDMIQIKTILYGTTKRALTYFTRAFAKELKGTSVCAGRLSPGMMLTDFLTESPDGREAPLLTEKNFKFIFNVLGDKPETVAAFFIPRILSNKKNDAHIVWLTGAKSIWRFMTIPFGKRKLI
jgi:NAD(P)-dependent dehydrogenase (short-subunit alcohol dehydrogenase family)